MEGGSPFYDLKISSRSGQHLGVLWHPKADDDELSPDSSLRSSSAYEVAELEEKCDRLSPDAEDSLLDEIAEQALESERQVDKGLVHGLEESLREEHALGGGHGHGHSTLDALAGKFVQLAVSRKRQTTEMIELIDRREANENGHSCIVHTVHQMKRLLDHLHFHWHSFSGPGGGDAFLHMSMDLATAMESKSMQITQWTMTHRAACLAASASSTCPGASVAELIDFQECPPFVHLY
ncbi:Hypothetical predicted protein [Cloeon dipterum]|uniref:Uncharacterized protein n=1 Tax=Cloeon dipterum TaxID=197152 RepID=A0A8S1CGK3_9INSE|nr:Hypothetical predicted protein [Cloeon dipterum]